MIAQIRGESNHFWEECEDVNWQNECLQEEVEVLEKALELACLVISKAMCPNGNWEMLKRDFANAYKEQAKEIMKSE